MTASPRLSGRAVWLLSRAALRGTRLVHERLAAHGLRKQHYGVLAVLADTGAMTQAALADRLGLDRSDMVALLDELERRAAVLRAADPADRRCKIVRITPGGETLLAELDDLVFAADAELLTPLAAAERDTLVTLLARLFPATAGDPPAGKAAVAGNGVTGNGVDAGPGAGKAVAGPDRGR